MSQTAQGTSSRRRKILFICGSLNQTTQMHQIAQQLPELDHAYTPFYSHGYIEALRRAHCLEFTPLGFKLRRRCLDYLDRHGLPIELHGAAGGYDLVLICQDLTVPRNTRKVPLVLVQEGILDPAGLVFHLCRKLKFLPRWLAGTATTGLSGRYQRFCVASEGYRDLFIANGAPAERIVVTGIPNFDDCGKYERNDFPHRHFVLVCSSDARETFKLDDRRKFIGRCLEIAAGRQLIFKLHPNENAERARREIAALAPAALVYASGCAEEMIANCDVLITQYSSTVFVGLALGKEVHSYNDLEAMRRLLPLQNRSAARNIAAVCRELLEEAAPAAAETPAETLPVRWSAALLRLTGQVGLARLARTSFRAGDAGGAGDQGMPLASGNPVNPGGPGGHGAAGGAGAAGAAGGYGRRRRRHRPASLPWRSRLR
jgi:hypothetical protein